MPCPFWLICFILFCREINRYEVEFSEKIGYTGEADAAA